MLDMIGYGFSAKPNPHNYTMFEQANIVEMLKGLFILYFILWWWLDKFLRLLTLFLFIGLGIYAVLWYKAFTDHDYYQLIYVVPFVFLVITDSCILIKYC